MDQYSNYIRRLKQEASIADFGSLHRKIEERCAQKVKAPVSKPLVGLIMITLLFLLALPLLLNRSGSAGEANNLTAYVFQGEEMSDHVVADFILSD